MDKDQDVDMDTDMNMDVTKPDISKTDVTKSGVTKPGVTKPGVTKPGVTKPGVTKPDVTMQTSMSTSMSTSSTSTTLSTFVSSLFSSTLSSSSSSSSSSSTSTMISSSPSSSSGSEPPSIFFANYVKALSSGGLLQDFTSEKYDEAAAALVSAKKEEVPEILRELHIEGLGDIVGVTIPVEGGRIRYGTTRLVYVAGNLLTLIVNKRPINTIYYQLPSKGPVVDDLDVELSSKDHGFKTLDEPAIISPVWSGLPTFASLPSKTIKTDTWRLLYSYQRGIPLVDSYPNKLGDDCVEAGFSWQLTQYYAYDPEKPDSVGKERFIFTGHKKKHSLSGFYMRLVDLKKRLEFGNETVAAADIALINTGKAPYPLWKSDGKLLGASELMSYFSLPTSTRSSSGDSVKERVWFLKHCELVKMARLGDGLYNVLSRFWDKEWDPDCILPDCILELNPYVVKDIMASAAKRYKANPSLNPKADEKYLMDLIKEVMGEREFQPKLSIDYSPPDKSKYTEWGRHPFGLYTLWMDSVSFKAVSEKNKFGGVWLPPRPRPDPKYLKGPDSEIQKGLSSMSTYKTGKQAHTTDTLVTSFSIDNAKNFKRYPDQVTAMGKKSPNDLVRSWWTLSDGEKAAEWLHRSAWSYGGLFNDGKIDPLSSQVMSNLIIGTQETNTMMIRYEIFVKRYAYYKKQPVRVQTAIVTKDMITAPDYAWYCHKLLYTAQNDSTKVKLLDTQFDPFDRRLPTRLELDLDELFESLVWGWGDSEFMG